MRPTVDGALSCHYKTLPATGHGAAPLRIVVIGFFCWLVQLFALTCPAIAQSLSEPPPRTPAIASSQDRTQPASVQPALGQPALGQAAGVPQLVPNAAAAGSGLRPSLPAEAWMGNGVNQPHSDASPPTGKVPSSQTKVRHRIPPAEAAEASVAVESGGSTGVLRPLISIGSSLLIVLGAFFALVWVYRKSSNTSMNRLPKQVVQVLGQTQLAARQNLILLRFGSKLVLVSLAPGETRTIGEITDPLEVDQLAGLCESNTPNSLTNSFKSILSQGGA